MAERRLHALQPRTYVPRTSDGRADLPSPSLLVGQPAPTEPNRVWLGDFTFLPTQSGWLYLSVVIDLCSRRIVGWALANHMRAYLLTVVLRQALATCLATQATAQPRAWPTADLDANMASSDGYTKTSEEPLLRAEDDILKKAAVILWTTAQHLREMIHHIQRDRGHGVRRICETSWLA